MDRARRARRPRRAPRRTGRDATLLDVGREAGVSAMTASRALHRPHLVAPETAARVRDAVRRLDYVPNRLAGGLSSRRSFLVVAVVPSTLNPTFAELVHTLQAELHASGYELFLGLSDYAAAREDELVDAVLGRRPDGIVLTGVEHSPGLRRRLLRARIPVVETWDLTRRPIDMLVGFSNEAVGRAAAGWLLDRGRRYPALVMADDPRAQARRAAFLRLLEARRVRLAGEVVVRAPSSAGDGREALARLLETAPRTDAVFCSSDQLAMGVLFEAAARRVRVPERLAVMGFGNAAISAHTHPPLTTVAVDGARIGREAARLLLRRLAGGPEASRSRILDVGFTILARGTS
jgi:LacI family transcriptional regulator, gluconate utilization system Gnt-I transcriptional repressor